MSRIVSPLKGVKVPLDSARWSSCADMAPLRSTSTLTTGYKILFLEIIEPGEHF